MITAHFTREEIQSLILSLESERDLYLKDCGSSPLTIVRDVVRRVVEQNNQLIEKLEALIGEGVPF